ncbi:hypothetical protein IFR05_004344 [Cadophora sp. M221]|nr:hypothetical protein IFR05_004344 [Cadophora sp. M221]
MQGQVDDADVLQGLWFEVWRQLQRIKRPTARLQILICLQTSTSEYAKIIVDFQTSKNVGIPASSDYALICRTDPRRIVNKTKGNRKQALDLLPLAALHLRCLLSRFLKAGEQFVESLQYNSGTGNGSFGFGWQLPVTQITRRTDRGLPPYCDEVDSDTYVLRGFDDLVPLLRPLGDKEWERAPSEVQGDDGESFNVRQYLPRLGALTVRIEQWISREFGDIHWRVISAENVTTVYGEDHISRVFDPEDPESLHPKRTFSWLPSRSWDDRGNATQYMFKREDLQSVDLSKPNEASRYRDTKWLFELVLDYGEHNPTSPTPEEQMTWPCRRDPFSTFRPGFEIRQYRLCQRILMFHNFLDEPGIGVGCLVGSTDFMYRQENPSVFGASESLIGEERGSFIEKATSVSYIRQPVGYDHAKFPPLEFSYSEPLLGTETLNLDLHSLRNLPQGLDGSAVEWVDLYGEGMPGILTKSEGCLIYKPNLGDWVDFAPPIAGFFKGKLGGSWERFQEFRQTPNIDWKDRGLRFLDLTGDSLPDAVFGEGQALTWYQSQVEEGFGEQRRQYMQQDELRAPRLMFADPIELIWLADMTGDGLMDVMRIDRGGIRYWPNLGYGRFGNEIIMSNAPTLGQTEDCIRRNLIRLADLDGSGTTDLVYLGKSGAYAYYNECGNSWQNGIFLEAFPRTDSLAAVHIVDLLGSGTMCLVWSSSLPTDAGTQMRYIDLMGGQKPHLLTRMINNLGTETSYNYAASTKFYQSAKQEGSLGAANQARSSDVPPLLTRHWFHTGQSLVTDTYESKLRKEYYHEPGLTETQHGAMFLVGSTMPQDITTVTGNLIRHELSFEELAQATRALRGSILREEVFAQDASANLQASYDQSPYPYVVNEYRYNVNMLEPHSTETSSQGVLFSAPAEKVKMYYERRLYEVESRFLADPRVEHELTLRVNTHGQPLEALTVSYSRRHLSLEDQQFSSSLSTHYKQSVLATVKSYTNAVSTPTEFRTPL